MLDTPVVDYLDKTKPVETRNMGKPVNKKSLYTNECHSIFGEELLLAGLESPVVVFLDAGAAFLKIAQATGIESL
jgi:hypothetical protein